MLLQNRMGDESVESKWGILKSIIVSTSGKQLEKRRKTTNKKAWYDKDCEDAVNKRNERRLRTLKYPSNENIESFKRSRYEARKLIRQKKRAAQNEMIEICVGSSPTSYVHYISYISCVDQIIVYLVPRSVII